MIVVAGFSYARSCSLCRISICFFVAVSFLFVFLLCFVLFFSLFFLLPLCSCSLCSPCSSVSCCYVYFSSSLYLAYCYHCRWYSCPFSRWCKLLANPPFPCFILVVLPRCCPTTCTSTDKLGGTMATYGNIWQHMATYGNTAWGNISRF